MESNDQNQNNEGFRPADQQPPVSNVDGFVTNPRPEPSASIGGSSPVPQSADNVTTDSGESVANQPAPTTSHEVEVAKLKQQKKGMSIWLVVLLVILFAGAAAVAVYFYQSNQAQKELDAAKAQTAQAQKDLAAQQAKLAEQEKTATQQTIDQLKTENATLKAENDALKKQVSDLTAYANSLYKITVELKTKCGTACSTTTVPPVPTAPTATTTN